MSRGNVNNKLRSEKVLSSCLRTWVRFLSESAWEEKARENALADITQQISVLIETNSFFVTMELNDSYKEYFEQTTKVSAKNLLEGHELVGSYKDKKTNTFYIGYKLDKQTYLRNKAKKEKEIADAGYGYLKEAQKALNGGNLFRSLTYFEKGLAVVEPWLFLDLSAIYNGQKIDVPNALYTGYVSAFDGLQLTLEPKELTLAGESTGEDIRLHLTRRGANVAKSSLKLRILLIMQVLSLEKYIISMRIMSICR